MKTRLMMFVAVIALFVFNGCSDSKESYVKDFKKFIEKVEAAGSDYTEEDWKKADEKFETFTGDRYEKFSSELTIDEQIEITKLKATYATRRGLSNLKNGVDKLLDSDILKMEKNKKRIIENLIRLSTEKNCKCVHNIRRTQGSKNAM